MTDALLERLVLAFEAIVRMYEQNEARQARRERLELEVMEQKRTEQSLLSEIAQTQRDIADTYRTHIQECNASHRRTEEMLARRAQQDVVQ